MPKRVYLLHVGNLPLKRGLIHVYAMDADAFMCEESASGVPIDLSLNVESLDRSLFLVRFSDDLRAL